jgi:2-methylcitrate dehydratase
VISRGELDLDRLTDFSGWRILNTRFKTLALNGTTHAHVMATLRIVTEHDLRPDDIAAVRLRVPVREARHTTAPPKKYPRNAESADHSAHYANAVAIRDRAVLAESVRPELFVDPVVLGLIERITVEPDPSLTYYQGASEIVTRDERRFTQQVDTPHGFGDDPLTDAEIEAKVRELASGHMPAQQIDDLIATCWRLEELDDLEELTRLLVYVAAG